MESNSNNPQAKTVLVTGATSGIGKATAKYFAKKGYNVILTGRRAEQLELAKNKLNTKYGAKVQTLCFDITDRQACEKAFNSLEGGWEIIDILINNAGGARGLEPIQEGRTEDWEYMIDANVKGLLYMSRLISPGMVKGARATSSTSVLPPDTKFTPTVPFIVPLSTQLMP